MANDIARRKAPWRPFLAGALVVLILIFVFQNTASIGLRYLWIHFHAPLWLMLAITLLVGIAVGWLVRSRRRSHSR